ncbi:MAG: hypothetical protein KAW92_11810 [Candidatus Cloacimonetes bacterium]|nr:hypothetical protein [Candidatus Cloacimonadota bacterium]
MKITVYWAQFIIILLIYLTGIIVGSSVESALAQAVISLVMGGLAMTLCIRSKKVKG